MNNLGNNFPWDNLPQPWASIVNKKNPSLFPSPSLSPSLRLYLTLSLSVAFSLPVPLSFLPLTRFPLFPTFTGQMPKAVLLCPQLPSLTVLCKTLLMCVRVCVCVCACMLVFLPGFSPDMPSLNSQSSKLLQAEARPVSGLTMCGLFPP